MSEANEMRWTRSEYVEWFVSRILLAAGLCLAFVGTWNYAYEDGVEEGISRSHKTVKNTLELARKSCQDMLQTELQVRERAEADYRRATLRYTLSARYSQLAEQVPELQTKFEKIEPAQRQEALKRLTNAVDELVDVCDYLAGMDHDALGKLWLTRRVAWEARQRELKPKTAAVSLTNLASDHAANLVRKMLSK